MKRLRNKFIKDERVRFISHLDLLRLFQRALRRADIKVAFSQGFNPHPKISFGPALMVGATTEGDYFDIDIEEDISPEEFKIRMNEVLPPGVEIVESFEVGQKDVLSVRVKEAEYILEVKLMRGIDDIEGKIQKFIKKDVIEVEKESKKGKKIINMKPYISEVKLLSQQGNRLKFYIKLKLEEGAPNPLHFLKAFNDYLGGILDMDAYKLHRKSMILD